MNCLLPVSIVVNPDVAVKKELEWELGSNNSTSHLKNLVHFVVKISELWIHTLFLHLF